MRRADRLFTLLLYLRRPRAVTARELARKLEVSERTVYRDVRDLSLSGVPVEGEAGVGYRLKPGFEVPPLMFDRNELAALRLGAQMVQGWADVELAAAAESSLAKIECVLPASAAQHPVVAMHVPTVFLPDVPKGHLRTARKAIEANRKLSLQYVDVNEAATTRTVWPFGLAYWGRTWTLGAWCEMRAAYRDFRMDRVRVMDVLEDPIPMDGEANLEGYVRNRQQTEC